MKKDSKNPFIILLGSLVLSALVVAVVPPNWATAFMTFSVIVGVIGLIAVFAFGQKAGADLIEFVVMGFGLGISIYLWQLLQAGGIFPIVINWAH